MLSILGEKVIDMSKEDSKTTSQKKEQIILIQLGDVFLRTNNKQFSSSDKLYNTYSPVPSKDAVSANIKHIKYFHIQVSDLSTLKIKSCMT